MMPSADFREELRKVFGVKKPKQVKDSIALPVHNLPKKEDKTKTVGDPMIAYSAQQIYNPQLLPVPAKPPTQVQANRGGGENSFQTCCPVGQVWPQIQQPPQSPMDENTMATGRAINDKEQELTTQQVKDAQQTTLTAFDSSIRNKVFRDWSTWQNPFKGDFDSFYAEVYNETNGFDPKNANTARVIAGSDFQNYQKDLSGGS